MESLFRLSDSRPAFGQYQRPGWARDAGGHGLKSALLAFLAHRRECWWAGEIPPGEDRSAPACPRRPADRLSRFDEVIRIVRFEDEPKAKLIATFELSDIQAEAILNTACASWPSSRRWSFGASTPCCRGEGGHQHGSPRRRSSGNWSASVCATCAKLWDPRRRRAGGDRRLRRPPSSPCRKPSTPSSRASRSPSSSPIADDPSGPVRSTIFPPLQFKEGDKLAFAVPARPPTS